VPNPLFLRRPSGLYVRFFVLADVRAQIGRRFLVRPLYVAQPDQARLAAAFMGAALSGVFEAMRQGMPVDIEEALKAAGVAGRRDWSAARVVLPSGIVLEGVEGTEREALALFHGIAPNDDVANIGRLTLDEIRQRAKEQQEKEAGPKFSERAAVFLGDMKRAGLSYGNLESTQDTLEIFQSVVGDKPLKSITKDDVRLFLDAVADWPTNASKMAEFGDMTPREVLAAAQGRDLPRLSQRSQNKHRENIGKFFNAKWRKTCRTTRRTRTSSDHPKPSKRYFLSLDTNGKDPASNFQPLSHSI